MRLFGFRECAAVVAVPGPPLGTYAWSFVFIVLRKILETSFRNQVMRCLSSTTVLRIIGTQHAALRLNAVMIPVTWPYRRTVLLRVTCATECCSRGILTTRVVAKHDGLIQIGPRRRVSRDRRFIVQGEIEMPGGILVLNLDVHRPAHKIHL